MIPQRVKIEGFLSYKQEQEVVFDGAKLWMLAGLNGSGKSSVFDAVTYVLFGHHRGGSQDAQELINKDSEKARVDFEFTLGEQRYAAVRTIQRTRTGSTRTTHQLFQVAPNGQRQPVEGRHLKVGYEKWIEEHIGLTYEVFTSSVMLRQGEAEKLLDAGPAGRHKVLAGIVDLERYERLHKRAEEERKGLEFNVKSLKLQCESVLEVTPLELAAAESSIAEMEDARQRAQQEVERLDALAFQAQKWKGLQSDLAIKRQRWDQAQKLVEESGKIEKDVQRLEELRAVLPRLEILLGQRGEIQKSELRTAELQQQWRTSEERLLGVDNSLGQVRQKITSLQHLIEEESQRQRQIQADLREAGARMEKLKAYEQQVRDLESIRRTLARMPADPAAALQQARKKFHELSELAQAVPMLTVLHERREALRQAQQREQETTQARDSTRARGEQVRTDVDALKPAVESAHEVVQSATAQATAAQTMLDHARRQHDALTQLQGEKKCSQCGQPLTEKHLREELARRKDEIAAAEKTLADAAAAQKAAQKKEQQARKQLDELEKKLQETREAFKEQRTLAEQAARDVERLQQESRQAWIELPQVYQERIAKEPAADWSTTSYPTVEELAELRRRAQGMKAAREQAENAEKVFTEWNTFKGQETAARQQVARLEAELPADRESIRSEHTRLDVEEQALDASLKARRQELDAAQRDLTWLTEERGKWEKQRSEIKGQLDAEEAARRHSQQTAERALKELPETWRSTAERAGMGDLFRWRNECEQLVSQGTEERGRQLQQARVSQEVLRHDLAVAEEAVQKFPAEAKREPEEVTLELRQARKDLDEKADRLRDARQHRKELDEQRQRRAQLQEAREQAERELNHATLLAELLGRKRLQLHLVRQAERQVVDHANAILDRLSGGQLYLRLVGQAEGEGQAETALELEVHNRITGEKPINVAFLSGSQKFRVAVSLALGLGQYASRQHRPIESVIIDEGFGCLDKEGRQAMIQELHNLRGQLRCILLVSHQEEFADAFADGYHFELCDGSTRVKRFQR
jgi:DNA repair exonuclease SbcCD ATPase subunit